MNAMSKELAHQSREDVSVFFDESQTHGEYEGLYGIIE
jgi:hypothetical protein